VSELPRLHAEDLERLAELVAIHVADLLAKPRTRATLASATLVTAADVARRFGVTAEWVREHADELGAVRLGNGPRPRLRFDLERVAEALEQRAAWEAYRGSSSPDPPASADVPARWRRRPAASSAQLLPIRGRER
jgi:hypothetical protein